MSTSAGSGRSAASAKPSDDQILSKSQPVPRWIPVSLLALTTAALVVPVTILRRHRSNMLSKALQDAPPPPRRTAGSGAGKAVVLPPTFSVSTSTSVSASTEKAVPQASPEDSFNFALYAAKAFGYATLIVTAGAVGSVWGVKTYMGVKDTQEFADRMRVLVREKMPVLSSRIHRPPAEEDHTATIWNDPTTAKTPHIVASEGTGQTEWAWSDAEKRLTAAFERDGFSGWAQAAMQELEAEGRAERQKRGHE